MFARHRPSRRFALLTTSPSSPLRPPTATDDADFWKVRPVRQAKGALDDEFRTDRKIIDYSAPPSHIVYSCFSPYPHSTSRPATRSLPTRACLQSFCPNDTSILRFPNRALCPPRATSSACGPKLFYRAPISPSSPISPSHHLNPPPSHTPSPPHRFTTPHLVLAHPPPTHSCRKRTAAPTPSSAPQRTTSTSSSSGPRGTL